MLLARFDGVIVNCRTETVDLDEQSDSSEAWTRNGRSGIDHAQAASVIRTIFGYRTFDRHSFFTTQQILIC